MRAPLTITATIQAVSGRPYRASLTGWGVDDLGHYGSVWSRVIELEGTTPESSAREVLRSLSRTLDSATV